MLNEIGVTKHKEPFSRMVHQGMILGMDGEKMSKSRGNVINPDDVVDEHGADALRLYEMFMGPLEAVKPWQTSQVSGVVRFRDKVHALCRRYAEASGEEDGGVAPVELGDDDRALLHKTMRKVTSDVDKLAFNTAISALMVLTNALTSRDLAKPGHAPAPLEVRAAPPRRSRARARVVRRRLRASFSATPHPS